MTKSGKKENETDTHRGNKPPVDLVSSFETLGKTGQMDQLCGFILKISMTGGEVVNGAFKS